MAEQVKGEHIVPCTTPKCTWHRTVGDLWACECGQWWRLERWYSYDDSGKAWERIECQDGKV